MKDENVSEVEAVSEDNDGVWINYVEFENQNEGDNQFESNTRGCWVLLRDQSM